MSYQQDHYDKVYSIAKNYGANDVQAHLAAAQSSLETGYGKKVAGGSYFGIKAGSSYKGATKSFKTHEVIGGKRVGMTDRFRSYSSLDKSVKGYMDFMAAKFSKAWGRCRYFFNYTESPSSQSGHLKEAERYSHPRCQCCEICSINVFLSSFSWAIRAIEHVVYQDGFDILINRYRLYCVNLAGFRFAPTIGHASSAGT